MLASSLFLGGLVGLKVWVLGGWNYKPLPRSKLSKYGESTRPYTKGLPYIYEWGQPITKDQAFYLLHDVTIVIIIVYFYVLKVLKKNPHFHQEHLSKGLVLASCLPYFGVIPRTLVSDRVSWPRLSEPETQRLQRAGVDWARLNTSSISKRGTVSRSIKGLGKNKNEPSAVFRHPLAWMRRSIQEQERLAYEKRRYSKCINALYHVLQIKSKGVRTLGRGFIRDIEVEKDGPKFSEEFLKYPSDERALITAIYDILVARLEDRSGVSVVRILEFLQTEPGRTLVDNINDVEWMRNRRAKLRRLAKKDPRRQEEIEAYLREERDPRAPPCSGQSLVLSRPSHQPSPLAHPTSHRKLRTSKPWKRRRTKLWRIYRLT